MKTCICQKFFVCLQNKKRNSVILKHSNIKIKVKEVLEGEKYKLIDGDIVTKQEIKEFINEHTK